MVNQQFRVFDAPVRVTGSSEAATNYGVAEKLLSLHGILDSLASSETYVQMQRIQFKGILRTYNGGRFCVPKMYLTICRNAFPSNKDLLSQNSYEGWLGSSDVLNAEYVAYELPIGKPEQIIGLSGTEFDILYPINISWSPPKKYKKVFRSSEQITDSPSLFKDIGIVLGSQDALGTNDDFEFNGLYSLYYSKHQSSLDLYAGPAL